MRIRTLRLDLISSTPEIARADLLGRSDLEAALGVRVPEEWPPELYDPPAIEYGLAWMEGHPDNLQWSFYYLVRRGEGGEADAVIGVGGYKGAPSENGTVEVGYSILPPFRRRGYATEAVEGWVRHAFADPRVRRVIAETLPELSASIGVLEKSGFRLLGPGSEPGVIRYERLRDAS
jgi:RimJ/RimL family protein N-acetyltransferase